MKDPQATLAVLGCYSLVGVLVLVLVIAALVRSERLLVLLIVNVEVLLLFWAFSLWRLA
jgi:hypothetical protein